MEDAKRVVDQALGSGRPWWQACCLGCGIFIFAVAVAAGWFVHSISGPGMASLTTLPGNIPANIKLYHASEARSIRYVPAAQKRGIAERLLAPFRLLGIVTSSTGAQVPAEVADAMSHFASSTYDLKQIQVFNADTLFVDWGAIPDVKSQDVVAYYRNMLEKAGFSVQTDRDEAAHVDILAGDRSDASFQVDVKGSATGMGIDEIRVVVNYVAQ